MKSQPKAPTSSKRTVTSASASRAAMTPLEVTSRAIDRELHWYFSYAEKTIRRQGAPILPSYAAARILTTHPTEEARYAKGDELARAVKAYLHALKGRHASVLRTAYTPRRWPRSIEKAFHVLAPIAVRLAFADDPWPVRSTHAGLEKAVAAHLSASLNRPARAKVARLRHEANRLLRGAVLAYARERSLHGESMEVR
jgi:hypothetical protein